MEEHSLQQELQEKKSLISRKEAYKGKSFALRQDSYRKPDGSTKTWDIIVHPGAVTIIPITDQGEIILVKQWRRAIEKRILELPAGTLESGELPDACAGRELQEETGFRAGKIIPLGGFYSTPGFCTEYLHLFLALNLTPNALPPDEDEKIDLLFLPLKKCEEMIQSGEICDLKTIAGIHRYVQWLP